jgi:electron transfer flavoprotein alpha/beta subunit
MTRHLRSYLFGAAALLVAAPLVLTTSAQSAQSSSTSSSTSARMKAADKPVRDLAPASAESVGLSSERVRRIEANMKRLVDEKQVSGLVTLLERHGKVVHFNAVGVRTSANRTRCRRTRSSGSIR